MDKDSLKNENKILVIELMIPWKNLRLWIFKSNVLNLILSKKLFSMNAVKRVSIY